jgi:X-Pro dipeptidyl-peptidase
MPRTSVAVFASALATVVVFAAPDQAPQKAAAVFVDGQAQVVPAFQDPADWIHESLWVEGAFDSDRDGKNDRMFVDVTRPRQTDTEGLKVPVIYESSPYYAGTSGPRQNLWNVQQELGVLPPPRIDQPEIPFKADRASVSTSLVAQWVPRGFAVVHSDAPGTGRSQGCVTVGDSPEQLAPKAVIDWLNGRAKGYTTETGTGEVSAVRWSTGKVGMTGTSYDGTIPLAAAVTGVTGLEAIIPVAPNTSYYHYYRTNGLVRHPGGWLGEDIDFLYDYIESGDPAMRATCNAMYRDKLFAENRHRDTGDYNAFWAARDLLPKVGNIKAAVLMAHAFNDWNVVPEHSVRIYTALKGRVPLMSYFHQGGHGGNPPMELMNKWFTRYLYGVQNGIEKEPRAWIVREAPPAPAPAPDAPGRGGRAPMPAPTPYADYPNPDASPVTLMFTSGGHAQGGLQVRTSTAATRSATTEKLVDDVQFTAQALAASAESPNRLLYVTPLLSDSVHLSGFAGVTLKLASSKPAANLSVYLVALPWSGPNPITRGWADPQNHASLTGLGDYHSTTPGMPLVPGQFVSMTFPLEPTDKIVPAGARLGVMVFSSDREFTLWPKPGTELTIDLAASSAQLPVVGGVAAFTKALGASR